MSGRENSPEEVGWRFEVDPAAGELHLEHAESGTAYVLDAEGGLRVPGGADAGGDLGALQETLASALGESDAGSEAVTDGGQAASPVEYDESTGEVTIESNTGISLEAPTIELSADGNATVEASGVLTLQGSLIELN